MATNSKEQWKEISLGKKNPRTRYAISDQGNICSFHGKIGDGKQLRGTKVNGYKALKLKIDERDLQFYVHKIVAGPQSAYRRMLNCCKCLVRFCGNSAAF